ncbi:MAG: helix-turn-helix domain-containing protein [Candidatus Gracilibacteria bacterium]
MENLVKLGFTEKEARVYLMLFRTGPSPVSSLAKRVGMKRVTVYSVLESLMARGIITYEHSGEGRKYIPHDPECLLDELDREKASLQMKLAVAKDCIDQLQKSSALSEDRPNVTFYKGEDGVVKGFLSFLSKNPFRGLLLLQQMPQFLLRFLKSLKTCNDLNVFLVLSKEIAPLEKELAHFDVCVSGLCKANHHALFVQDDHVFFLHLDPLPQLIVITDSAYAEYVTDVLMIPFLK